MKRITNILSCLGLLLLLMVAACSDWEEPAQPMIDDEETGEVELTIQTQVPGMEGASRAIPTEKITSITALAFDRDTTLIKGVSAEITPSQDESKKDTTGTFSVKVPLRTRSIHFIAKRDGDFTEITTENDYGKKAKDLLIDRTSDELHYWAMLEFENGEDLKDLSDELGATGGKLDLIRNFAKVKLNLPNDMDGHIAGFLNYNVTGTIVPSKDGAFGYQTQTNHTMPPTFYIKSDTIDRELDTEYYLFEEKNVKGDDGFGVASDLVYTICKIDSLYYKIAFKSGDVFNPIIRNQAYNITISKDIDKTRGKTDYKEAVNAKPVNDAGAKLQIHMDFDPSVVFMFLNEVYSVTVANIDSIQTLQIGYSQDFFGQGGIAIEGITPTSQDTATTSGEKTIWVDTYTITDESGFTLTIDLDNTKVTTAAKDIEVQFLGEGENVYVNDILTVHALEQGDLTTVSPTTIQIPKTAGSTFTAQVTIPTYNEDVGDFELWVGDTEGAFTVTPPDDLKLLADGYYDVTEGQTYEFTFTLNEEGEIDAVKEVVFYVVTDYHRLVGTTTVTLLDDTVPEQDSYELWVENGAWNGSTGYNQFFTYPESITTGSAANLESSFYDDGANAHKSQHMVMGEGSSISFTISEQRYLTLLVAADSGTPSINLLKDGVAWTTSAAASATTVDSTYNFGNGEINADGRLIRYQLPAGTYTLRDSAAEYLLYYMRVTKDKPVMTDVAQPLLTDYELAWSGGEFQDDKAKGYLKIDETNSKHIVNEDKLTHTVTLKSDGNSLNTLLNLNLTTFTLNKIDLNVATTRITFENTSSNNYSSTKTEQNFTQVSDSYSLNTYNAGVYTLSARIDGPEYKYKAFYEKLQLKSVEYEVKSPIEPGLYNSMEGNVLTPVDKFMSQDEAWAIGFKMPMVVPDLEVSPENYTIYIDIPGWTKSDNGNAVGLGVEVIDDDSYSLQKQANANDNNNVMYHPREGWTYKIKWASVSHENIVPRLTSSDTDHYFTYKGTIAKEVSIPTPYEGGSNSLAVTLNFSYDVDGNYNFTNSTNLNNLKLNTSRVRLTATISSDDAQTYNGQKIQLNGSFSSNNSYGYNNSAIHWDYSRKGGDITYLDGEDHDGRKLQFTVISGQTDYYIDWIFETGGQYPGYGDIEFTYTIANSQGTGSQSAYIAFTNEPTNAEPDNTGGTTIWTGSQQWGDWSSNNPNYLDIYYFLPQGTEITLNVTSANGGAVEMHDCTLTSLRLESSNVTYPVQDDNYFNVGSGNTSPKFTVPSGGVNGLKITGSNVTITSVVVKYPNKTGQIFSYDFEDGNAIEGWGADGHTPPDARDGNLVLTNNNGGFAQAAVDMGYVPGSYTLTYRIRGSANGSIKQNFQHYYTPKNTDGTNGQDVYNEDINNPKDQATQFTTEWKDVSISITINKGANRLLLDYSNFTGTIYIDDLMLVKND